MTYSLRITNHSKVVTGSCQWVVLTALGSCLLGCGGGDHGAITGKVTFQGQPVTQGNIAFTGSGPSDVAHGKLNEEGVYELWQMGDGISPGGYRVTVTPLRTFQEVPDRDPKVVLVGGESIPKKYREKRNTPLKETITGEDQTFDFDLQP